MIQTTNDVREFIEEHDEPIYIYGAGNPGEWVGYYMHRCKIPFEGYLDRACTLTEEHEVRLKGDRVYNPRIINKYKNQRIRIIIAVYDIDSALGDLHWIAGQNDLYCLFPYYIDVALKMKKYNINKMLGYFRGKLFHVDVPTILSNQCDAGCIYECLGLPMMSPTINAGMRADDYLKFCRNLKEYLEKDMCEAGYEMVFGKTAPCARLGDIIVRFPHDTSAEEGIARWNLLKKWVNYDNIIYILSDSFAPVLQRERMEFMKLEGKKLMIIRDNKPYFGEPDKHVLSVPIDFIYSSDIAFENNFDILGWLNGDF